MAHKFADKNRAKQLYVVEGKKVEEIAAIVNVSVKSIYRWKQQDEWDKSLKSSGNIGIAIEMDKAFKDRIAQAISNGTLTEPSVADALYKTSKLMEKLLPKKIMLANIFNMLEDTTNYIKTIGNDKFLSDWARHLPEIADFLRKKYND